MFRTRRLKLNNNKVAYQAILDELSLSRFLLQAFRKNYDDQGIEELVSLFWNAPSITKAQELVEGWIFHPETGQPLKMKSRKEWQKRAAFIRRLRREHRGNGLNEVIEFIKNIKPEPHRKHLGE